MPPTNPVAKTCPANDVKLFDQTTTEPPVPLLPSPLLLSKDAASTTVVDAEQIGSSDPKGLLFMCLNGDLERQFEFLQQTWITSPSFHGLKNERDPLVGISASSAVTATFTVPTTVGPLEINGLKSFVTVKGGAYFFLPSRSALRFLSQDP